MLSNYRSEKEKLTCLPSLNLQNKSPNWDITRPRPSYPLECDWFVETNRGRKKFRDF